MAVGERTLSAEEMEYIAEIKTKLMVMLRVFLTAVSILNDSSMADLLSLDYGHVRSNF
jgi:hypothetical protein